MRPAGDPVLIPHTCPGRHHPPAGGTARLRNVQITNQRYPRHECHLPAEPSAHAVRPTRPPALVFSQQADQRIFAADPWAGLQNAQICITQALIGITADARA